MNSTSDKETVQIIVDLFARKGVKRVVISPGSRNAPLSITFNRDKRIECFVIVDERSAAFFALGMAQKSGEPVGLVCTSGTALLNYAPAVAEAFYQRIPLVVLSADRPTEWIGQDDSQAINQQQVFANFTKYHCQLPAEVTCSDEAWHVNRSVNEAINAAVSGRKGPVHINIPLREPLYGTMSANEKAQRTFMQFEPESTLSQQAISELRECAVQGPNILILAGFLPKESGDAVTSIIEKIESLPNVVVVAEPISNIQSEKSISTIDRVLNTFSVEEAQDFRPDILISFGGALVSKQIKTFLKKYPPHEHWYIGKGESHIDTFRQLTALIQTEPATFLEQFFTQIDLPATDFASRWQAKAHLAKERHDAFMQSTDWSDLKAFDIINQALPKDSDLQLGNSSAVRYGHLFEQKNINSIQSNRGTSGIDGSTSTAIGAAWLNDRITTFVSGDISFFYDSNAFWNKYLSPNLRVIVVKNGGGGIFRYIPGPSSVKELDDYFETAQDVNVEGVARLYNLPFYRVTNAEELEQILPQFFAWHEQPPILEVLTPRKVNDEVLRKYFAAMRN
jgi:2-succinyl-5-enolpyruvyl-6-hydroxy-3-cyclohexene-1-carboxylic-acid synthase